MSNVKNGKYVYKNEDSMKKMHEFYDKTTGMVGTLKAIFMNLYFANKEIKDLRYFGLCISKCKGLCVSKSYTAKNRQKED